MRNVRSALPVGTRAFHDTPLLTHAQTKHETRNTKHETRNTKHETRNTKRNETKRNETKRNETKRNETKRNETAVVVSLNVRYSCTPEPVLANDRFY
eukprot:COSAG06_NODE_834_length_11974_cov_5.664739_6_plen_97_part_00